MKKLIGALLACVVAIPALADPSVNHLTTGFASGTDTLTIPNVTLAAGKVLAMSCPIRAGASADTVTIIDDASDIFTKHVAVGFGTQKAVLAYVITAGLSAGNIVVKVSTSAAGNIITCTVDEIQNTNLSAPEDTSVYNASALSSTKTPSTLTGTPTQAGDLLYAATMFGNASMTEDPAWTNLVNSSGNTNGKGSMSYLPSAGASPVTYAPQFNAAVSYVQNVMAFASDGGGSPVAVHHRGLLGVNN